MEIWVITESYEYYKGADATTWRVCSTKEIALREFNEIIREKFEYLFDEEDDADELTEWIEERFIKKEDDCLVWEDEEDDAVTKFYIEKATLTNE